MTVKDVFELRRKGMIEEAYEAIRPLYAVHKGKYTSLAMFWTAHDILKKRIMEGKLEEARKILMAMQRMKPNLQDTEGYIVIAIESDKELLAEAIACKEKCTDQELAKAISASQQETDHNTLGQWGESVAIDHLQKKGYQIVYHDWKSGHRDIDIVAKDGKTLVFVEVKTRRSNHFGEPENAVDYKKLNNLQKAINHYIKQLHWDGEVRFDIIGILTLIGEEPRINHIEGVPIL